MISDFVICVISVDDVQVSTVLDPSIIGEVHMVEEFQVK